MKALRRFILAVASAAMIFTSVPMTSMTAMAAETETAKTAEETDEDNGYATTPDMFKRLGVVYWGGIKHTYYNLNMSGVVRIMRNAGFSQKSYPYSVNEDGFKMLGDYIMVAADLSEYPRGSIVDTGYGKGIVCDTGYLASNQFDIAVSW